MQQGSEGPRESRRLSLDRETLHDLEPGDDQTALVAGGDNSVLLGCNRMADGGILTFLGTTRTDEIIERTGSWVAVQTTRTTFSLDDKQRLIVHSVQTEYGDPEPS